MVRPNPRARRLALRRLTRYEHGDTISDRRQGGLGRYEEALRELRAAEQ